MQESVLAHLHLAYRSQLLLAFFVALEQLLLAGVITTVALCCYVLFNVGDVLLSDCL